VLAGVLESAGTELDALPEEIGIGDVFCIGVCCTGATPMGGLIGVWDGGIAGVAGGGEADGIGCDCDCEGLP
jgi:hypothetical protein